MRKTAVLSYVKCRAGEVFWFVIPPLAAFFYYAVKGVFVCLGPGAQLYCSIAENFCTPGHFIQTARNDASCFFHVLHSKPGIVSRCRVCCYSGTCISRMRKSLPVRMVFSKLPQCGQ